MARTRLRDRMWPVLNRLFRLHTWAYRATRGRVGHRFPGAPPMLLLDHVGARSGVKRTTPLAYMPDGAAWLVVASKGGHPSHPAWYHNLLANPDTEVQVGRDRVPVRAHVAAGEERARLWPLAVEHNPLWGGYQEHADREIPLVVLEPRPAT
ncbi:MAG TPA: nitroreductase family deazaflavin-dependent oxidoreductase [Actinomycetota bacterium]|nr:nitroreductase family deazaflavin-dependent oxidoreductase [Actinomycetota bacterium]